jgi:DNA repair exonuclease SbcCD ATPase subunit
MSEETANLSEQKAQLECEKLRAEIQAIHHPVYKTPGFYAAVAPVVLAIVGVIFTWSSGWFDIQRTRISNEKTLLEAENSRLTDEKERLTEDTSQLEAKRTALNERKSQDQQSIMILTNQLSQLERQRDEKEQIIAALSGQITNLTAQSEAAKALVKQINQLQAERDKVESQLTDARSHLATAYERARIMLIESGNVITTIKTFPTDYLPDYVAASAKWNFAIGKWRAGYEEDSMLFKLGDFRIDTNAAPKSQ